MNNFDISTSDLSTIRRTFKVRYVTDVTRLMQICKDKKISYINAKFVKSVIDYFEAERKMRKVTDDLLRGDCEYSDVEAEELMWFASMQDHE